MHRILWLYASAGSGKSAVASWFFFGGAGARGVISHFPITLVSQMRKTIPGVGTHTDSVITAEPGLETADTSLSVRLEHLWLYATVNDLRLIWEDSQRQGYISGHKALKGAQTYVTWSMDALNTHRDDVLDIFELLK